ncbi:hypothetical protein B0H14DRAFT_2958411 [Mycena olivaceomarginata]|nr:hypothetical protein B0H14DRAFT_2958411 [Mycena olivaceomarginata]
MRPSGPWCQGEGYGPGNGRQCTPTRFFFTTGTLKSPILQCLGESLSVAGSLDNLQTTAQNTRVSDELLASDCFKRLSGWANLLFWTFAPLLAAFVEAQMTILAESQPSLVWNFVGSVFAACTFNFGPHAITVPHLDFGNLS